MDAGFVFVLVLFLAPLILWRVYSRPAIACLGFIIFVYFRMHEAFPAFYPLHIPMVIALLMLVILVLKLLMRQVEVYWPRELKYFLYFSLVVTIGIVFAEDRETALNAWSGMYIKTVIFVFAVTWLFYQAKDFEQFNKVLLWCGIILAAVAISNFVNNTIDVMNVRGILRVTIGRQLGSMLGDPNDLALIFLLPLSVSIAYLLTAKASVFCRVISSIALPAMLYTVKLTQSRGGMLGVVGVVAVFLMQKIKSKVLLVLIGGSVLFAIIVASGAFSRSVYDASGSLEDSAMGRWIMWGNAIKMAAYNPFFGVGIANFANSQFNELNKAAHSMWFQILGDTGSLGFIFFMLFAIPIWIKNYKMLKVLKEKYLNDRKKFAGLYVTAQTLFAGMTGFYIAGSFLTKGFSPATYILLSVSIALQHYVGRELASGHEVQKPPQKELANASAI